jgi:hypothetical protein
MLKHWIHKLLKRMGFYGTLDTDKAIRALKVENLNLKKENAQLKEHVEVWADPTVYRTGAYDAPSPTTDGKMRAEGMRERSLAHLMYPHNGDLMRHKHEIETKKAQAVKLDPTPTQHNLPTLRPPAHKMTLLYMNDWLL